MNTRSIKPFSTILIASAFSLLNYSMANAQQKSHPAKHISPALSNNQVKNTEWHLLTAILNNDTKEIKQAAQKKVTPKKESKKVVIMQLAPNKSQKTMQTQQTQANKSQEAKQRKQSFFKIVHIKVVCVVNTLVATGSKIKHSIWECFRD